MEEWSKWLLKSLVGRACSLDWCSPGEITVLLQDEARSPEWWCLALLQSPRAAARLVTLANSAAFSDGRDVLDVHGAIEVLGHQTARRLIFQEMLERIFPARGREWIAVAPRWRHVLGVAAASAALARRVGLDAGEVFTASILHDIGQLVLLRQGGDPYRRIEQTFGSDPDPRALARAEEEHLGFDHCLLAAAIAARLELPSSIVSLLRDHHRVEQLQSEIEEGSHLKRVAAMDMAEQFSASLGYGPVGEGHLIEGRSAWHARIREIQASAANEVLKLSYVELWWMKRRIEQAIPSLVKVARGETGPLWAPLSPAARALRWLREAQVKLGQRLEQLRPAPAPRPLPAPVPALQAAQSANG